MRNEDGVDELLRLCLQDQIDSLVHSRSSYYYLLGPDESVSSLSVNTAVELLHSLGCCVQEFVELSREATLGTRFDRHSLLHRPFSIPASVSKSRRLLRSINRRIHQNIAELAMRPRKMEQMMTVVRLYALTVVALVEPNLGPGLKDSGTVDTRFAAGALGGITIVEGMDDEFEIAVTSSPDSVNGNRLCDMLR